MAAAGRSRADRCLGVDVGAEEEARRGDEGRVRDLGRRMGQNAHS
jgi:hypothetical protein